MAKPFDHSVSGEVAYKIDRDLHIEYRWSSIGGDESSWWFSRKMRSDEIPSILKEMLKGLHPGKQDAK